MSIFTAIDLSRLPAPSVVEPLDYEAILAARKAALVAIAPDLAPVLALESEPLVKFLEAESYRELILRQRINDAARAVMLAYARGSDLDQIAANVGVARLPGEDDTRFRARVQQSFFLWAAAGPAGAYKQHALGVSTDIRDVCVWSMVPGRVDVSVLARIEHKTEDVPADDAVIGAALFGRHPDSNKAYVMAPSSNAIMDAVRARLNAEDVRPLTDYVVVSAPEVKTCTIDAVIDVLPGPDPAVILTRRRAALDAHLESLRVIGMDVTRAGIIAALVEPGVKNVRLNAPAADITLIEGQIAACTSISISTEVVHG